MKNLYFIVALILLSVNTKAQDGALDTSFDPGTGVTASVGTAGIGTISIQDNGYPVIGGWMHSYNGTTRKHIARLNLGGFLDNGFDYPSLSAAVYTTAIQSDGKILVGGNTAGLRILRLNSDGTLDTTFNFGTSANNKVNAIAIQDDGKILIGGEFTTYNSVTRNRIARVNTDGSVDTSFDPGLGPDNPIKSISIQDDGKIVIGGNFQQFNGGNIGAGIARLNSDGSLDTSFDPGTGANSEVKTTYIQTDGKILIGGNFTLFNGASKGRIARLNTDGSLDSSFDTGSGADGSAVVRVIKVQGDGKILVGGLFSSFNGSSISGIVRLFNDGSIDNSFDPGTGANGEVQSIAIQSDGKLLIGGSFTEYNGVLRNGIARVSNTFVGMDEVTSTWSAPYPNPASDYLNIEVEEETSIIIVNAMGEIIQSQYLTTGLNSIDVSALPSGYYFIKNESGNITRFQKVD